ncbi:MAG: sensor domain-containing diguanylate cyclase [Planctomycetota bacterium]|jgi:diguanylate cyclase (GGDEF)-like protein
MINGIQDIPTLPQLTIEMIRHAFQEEPDIQHIATVIEKEPTLTAKLFKTVNSVAFGLRVEVTSVAQAISILGLETLKATIISIAVGEFFINNSLGNSIDAKEFCVHSLATAVIMSETAKELGIRESDQLFLVGLLHDLGMLALDTLDGAKYRKVLEAVPQGKPLDRTEKELFGCDNFQVWNQLAEDWNFPSPIIELNKGYVKGREISLSTRRLTDFSSSLAESLGYYFMKPKPRGLEAPMETFLLSDSKAVTRIGRAVKKQINTIAEILDLPSPDHSQLLELLWRMNLQLQKTNRRYRIAHNELRNRVEVLEELAKVFTGIIKSLNNDSLVFSVLEALIEGFHIKSAFLLHNTSSGALKGYAARSSLDEEDVEATVDQIQLEKALIPPSMQQCMENMAPIKLNHPINDQVLKQCLGNARLIWLAPIYVRGRFTSVMGLGIGDEKNNKFNSDDFGKIFHIIASEVGLSIENSRLYNRMKKEARTDPLTSISNRRTIMKILTTEFARFKRKGAPLTVAIYDLDNFKAINDNRGHLAGDEFLVNTAQILRKGIRESDYIGRYGGDEFIAVLPETTPEEAQAIVERTRKRLIKYCDEFNGEDLGKRLSVSAGIAGAEQTMTRADELINQADNALYRAKQLGRDLCVVHTAEHVPN